MNLNQSDKNSLFKTKSVFLRNVESKKMLPAYKEEPVLEESHLFIARKSV